MLPAEKNVKRCVIVKKSERERERENYGKPRITGWPNFI